jgi:hypothetical protein
MALPGEWANFFLPAHMFAGRNRKWNIDASATESTIITFDILLQESHGWNIKASTHPVEQGRPFTDHTEEMLRKGSMKAYITNFGLKRPNLLLDVATGGGTQLLGGQTAKNAAQDVFDRLEAYRENVEPVNIVTSLKWYKDYIITSCKAVRTGKTGEAQAFDLTFQEFRTVQLKSANVQTAQVKRSGEQELKDSDKAKRTSPNANTGEQKPKRLFSFKEYTKRPDVFQGG